jgi:hypothetical protein
VKRILLCLVALMLAPSTAPDAQGNDQAYCTELSALYRKYVQNAQGRKVDVEALTAVDDCQKGKTAAAIPVLEKRLTQSGFSLPKEFKP